MIPGTGKKDEKAKNVLFLPGAQKTALYFNCTARFKHKRTELGDGHLEVESLCLLEMRSTADVVAEGSGSCSTMESKYRTRNGERVCPTCGQATIIKGKVEYGGGWLCWSKRGGCGLSFGETDPAILSQVTGKVANPDIWDMRNTVLKMAAKRAQVAAALNLGAMSELFSQDIDEPHLADAAGIRSNDAYETNPNTGEVFESRGRDEINATFDRFPAANAKSSKDSRPFGDVVADGVEHIRAEFRGTYPDSKQELTNSFAVARHLYRTAGEVKLLTPTEKAKNSAVLSALATVYGKADGRKWLRKELTAYLGAKLTEAKAREEQEQAERAKAAQVEDDGDDDEAGELAAKLDRGDMYDPEDADSLMTPAAK